MVIRTRGHYGRVARILGWPAAIADMLRLLDAPFAVRRHARRTVRIRVGEQTALMYADTRDELFRTRRMLTKEPETVRWIDECFAEGDVFFDVGANVGVFTLYAALRHPGLRIFSFEPFFANFAKLSEHIMVNGLSGRVLGIPLAVSDATAILPLTVEDPEAGTSGSQFGGDVAQDGHRMTPRLLQGCAGMSLDTLVYDLGLPAPAHLKVDVDGLEPVILRGAPRLLADPSLRTVMVELTPRGDGSHETAARLLADSGFRLASTCATGTDETISNHLYARGDLGG